MPQLPFCPVLPYRRAAPGSRVCKAVLLVLTAAALRAEAVPPPAAGSPPLAPPLPGVVAFAKNQQLPLTGIERDLDSATSRPGDEVIALITLFKAGAVD